ncbi:MAG TPA: murein biosynthesis integral membrane protein MurJ, partial [bacterium]|nr:murein biosynthesis integral membrane protein MurJ [bacterium]
RNKNRILVFIGIFVSRISGYIRDFVIARYFGANIFTDAFFNAFTIPNLLRGIFAEGNLSSAFIPNFFDELKKSKEHSIELCRAVFSFLLYTTIIISLIGMLFSTEIASIMGYGFKSEEAKILSGEYLKIMFPILIFISISALCIGVLNSFHRFFITSAAPTILNLGMIIFVVFLRDFFGDTQDTKILSLCYGTLFGAIIYFLVLMFPYLKAGYKFSLKLRLNYEPLKKTIKLMLPGIPGQAIYEINFISNRIIASFLGVGSISYLYYANRLYQFPLALFGIGISSVLLTSAAKDASNNDLKMLLNNYYDTFKFMAYFIIPITLLSVLTADKISLLVYQKSGEFNNKTTIALQCYLLGLLAYAGANISAQIYYSLKDTFTPVKFSAMNMLLNIVLNVLIVLIWQNNDTRF